ncbi:hypothetical protein M8C21_002591 [Ambrosia artemisiifolia]|uniref:Uncharacterized protein n=1 Tax=Ambrosia artemisiifolia TaxID=4212 RepID=A0AAD5GXK3_AMBAR|nr:hypothetical protein M8C21_002591 [Ambrosia artemisiifolia]
MKENHKCHENLLLGKRWMQGIKSLPLNLLKFILHIYEGHPKYQSTKAWSELNRWFYILQALKYALVSWRLWNQKGVLTAC